jgi:hypothetical protein
MKPPNPPRITSNVWWGITAVAIFLIFLPGLIGLEGFNGGFAVSFIAFFLVIIGVIVAVIYMKRASVLDKIFKGENVLAHWTYAQEEWTEYAKKEYAREKAGKNTLFLIVAGISLLVGLGFLLVTRNSAGFWVFLSMLALIAIIGFTAWFTSWYNFRQNMKYLGETYITPHAVYLNRQLHTWNSLGAWLDSVSIKGDDDPYIEFKYMAPTRTGVQEYNVNVPIPKNKELEARGILDKFTTGKKKSRRT